MKINILEDGNSGETEVTIRCREADETIRRMAAVLQFYDSRLTGVKDGSSYILDIPDILYIDTADKKTFLYTETEVYETPLKLYELEEQLGNAGFFRAGKSTIINFNQIAALNPDLDGRITVTMSNGERRIVSRQYAFAIREKLGLRSRKKPRTGEGRD